MAKPRGPGQEQVARRDRVSGGSILGRPSRPTPHAQECRGDTSKLKLEPAKDEERTSRQLEAGRPKEGPLKRLTLIVALLAGLAVPAGASAADVSSVAVVQRDLELAASFWAVEEPALLSPCASDQVMVTSMADGVGDDGAIVPAADVWAETTLGSCEIDIAPVAWALGTSGDSGTSEMLCVLIAHEYGHTLGLPDTESIPMMSSSWSRRDDPLCDEAVYGWRWTLPKDREWIAANRPELRSARIAREEIAGGPAAERPGATASSSK
jgi:hypothetical protein